MADTHVLEPRKTAAARERVEIGRGDEVRRCAYAAYRLLHVGYAVLPIVAGLDKFSDTLVNWDMYLASRVEGLLPFSGHTFMQIVGAIEISAGILVVMLPRIGGFVVAGWLWGIILNFFLVPGFYDLALRDFGLSLGAIALSLLAGARLRPEVQTASEAAAARSAPWGR